MRRYPSLRRGSFRLSEMGLRWVRWVGLRHEGSQSPGDGPRSRVGHPIHRRMEVEVVRGGDEGGGGCPSPRREEDDEGGGGLDEQRKDGPRRMKPDNPRKDLVGGSNHE